MYLQAGTVLVCSIFWSSHETSVFCFACCCSYVPVLYQLASGHVNRYDSSPVLYDRSHHIFAHQHAPIRIYTMATTTTTLHQQCLHSTIKQCVVQQSVYYHYNNQQQSGLLLTFFLIFQVVSALYARENSELKKALRSYKQLVFFQKVKLNNLFFCFHQSKKKLILKKTS